MRSTQNLTMRRYTEIANDAALPLLTNPNLQGGDRFYSIATNTLFTLAGAPGARTWLVTTAGAGAAAGPPTQVFYGTGAGFSYSARFTFSATTTTFLLQDSGGTDHFMVRGNAGARNTAVFDAAGVAMVITDTFGAARKWFVIDAAGIDMFNVDTAAAVRTMRSFDSAGTIIELLQTLAIERKATLRDEAGRDITTQETLSTVRTLNAWDSIGAALASLDTLNRKLTLGCPVGNTGFTLAAANALTAAQGKTEGATTYITNGCKPTEGPGAGTGVPAYYSAAGPAGAGWYNYGLATLVTA